MERLTEQLVEARGKKGPDGSILLHSLQEYLGVVAALALQLRFFDLDTFKIRVMKRSMIKLGEEKKFEPLANYILHIPHLFGFTGDNYLPKYLEVEIKRRRQLSERNEQYDIVQFILDNPCLFDLNKIESIGYILSLLIHSGTTLLKVYLNKVFLDIALTPGVYEHLYQEQCHIIEEHGKKIELDILDKMEILDSTILESIRLSSHQEWLVRYLNKDFVLSNGVSLHKGTYVSFDMLGHTHNEKIFGKDPEKFNYKRFVRSGPMHQPLGDVSARNLLWGVGPRMCMGKDYSIAIMKLILSIHIRKYAIKPAFLGHKEGDTIHTFKIDKKPSFVYFIPQ
ncbi:Cytochrome [Zancudomyces culisetae]|uniref:Cytochrome n=1 Tax=Zancudomyces culisetae TaxID=1213189 RepID=A0A1R1PLA8_ZANCU|nr:Cytochrome [Zancudomyces culisetae]|eukprot:OMH81745.1 Cytochrome [Zancudomyces culisetae]